VKRIKICKSNNPAKGGGLNTQQLAAEISFQSLVLGFIPVIQDAEYFTACILIPKDDKKKSKRAKALF
jgi:hypothetical protein